jgi:hypothetical protein
MQAMEITQPAGNRDANRSIQGLPQVCHPLASAQPKLDKDPVFHSAPDEPGRGCTIR